ncbi:Phosphatidylinositol 3,4,5-trisphosphate-dependent Rac exchanger 2 protein [Cladophialophora chaetospira]|uniref:Phosphatidylinositol 3,4,5-trisphosphate-dependent Rac exchanger 2 protein n=1 Tax=Cladophialophora chaetospira TaxID=386627 RepID=A0AA38XKP1_9EURO|nr:Phosphatidylinositol 3,4,5-trisphosphate-dependent Rac exchanger 2 protein [Cladophialophora chaetospira]
MTGLNPSVDTILSISCILTNSDLAPLDSEGFNAVIHHTPQQLSQMSEWCIKTHGDSGLTQECTSSSTSAAEAAEQLLNYIKHFIPEPRRALLAGNSIHADRSFLMVEPWDRILEHLHYRLFDVSAMKEMVRRWGSDQVLMAAPRKELRHTAREDVLESIQEAQYYKTLIEGLSFVPTNLGNLAPLPAQPVILGSPTKQQQEALDMLRNNGTKTGDIGTRGDGFRTDVP